MADSSQSSPPKHAGSSPRSAAGSPPAQSSPPAANVVVEGQVSTTIHPEIEADYSESAYSDNDLGSDTTSLKSEILHYRFENGRRYHSSSIAEDNEYFVPNDEIESDRLDLTHHVMRIMQNGNLFGAPIGRNPQKILDIGTGTGIWAIEVADMFPSATVIGNDLSPIQPACVQFEIDDVEKEWTHTEGSFDLIYSRYMLGSIRDWPRLIRQAYKALRPGGYLEILEPDSTLHSDDGTLREDSPLMDWNRRFIAAAEAELGSSIIEAPRYKGYIVDAGFVDIHEDIFKLPNAPWPKDKNLKMAGKYHMPALLEGLEPLSLHVLTKAGMSLAETRVLFDRAKMDVRNKGIHTYFNLHRYVARKPE
ncbi:hypothetical protein TWF694_002043 [Orbilia ellipsospora]|uniref:Methyltransferase n=1 Tax=Orbilia ellipsospora TaxID=2528407 RepID=A0AAV9X5S3_9PEZI